MIPVELQEEIIKRIDDVKKLLRCTSVSKAWNCFIKSPEFIADYHIHRQKLHLLVDSDKKTFVSIDVDDDHHSFPQNKLSFPLPDNVGPFTVQGSSLGLFCFIIDYVDDGNGYGFGHGLDNVFHDYDTDKPMAVVWNPSIRKSIVVNYRFSPFYFKQDYRETFGFGVSPYTNDPMLVKIRYSKFLEMDDYDDEYGEDLTLDNIPSFPVEVYTLSSRVWTTLSISLPRKTIHVVSRQMVIDKFIYWIACDKTLVGNTFRDDRRLILSFDMKSQQFTEICLPKELASPGNFYCHLSKLWESLIVVESSLHHHYVVWKMECGVPNSFEQLYAIKVPYSFNFIQLRFRKSGGHIILTHRAFSIDDHLFVYEPDSKDTYKIGTYGRVNYIDTYMETLLLLN